MRINKDFFSAKVIVALLLIYATCVGAAVFLSSPTNPIFRLEKFNKTKWLQDVTAGRLDNKQDCTRGKMAQDLIDHHLTQDLTKTDVLSLLGDADILSKTSIEYPIGWCGYNYTNSVYIEFDGDHLQKAYLLKR